MADNDQVCSKAQFLRDAFEYLARYPASCSSRTTLSAGCYHHAPAIMATRLVLGDNERSIPEAAYPGPSSGEVQAAPSRWGEGEVHAISVAL